MLSDVSRGWVSALGELFLDGRSDLDVCYVEVVEVRRDGPEAEPGGAGRASKLEGDPPGARIVHSIWRGLSRYDHDRQVDQIGSACVTNVLSFRVDAWRGMREDRGSSVGGGSHWQSQEGLNDQHPSDDQRHARQS
jgi:hypothetical protein